MGLAPKRLSPVFVNFGGTLTPAEVDSVVADRLVTTMQTSSPVNLATAELLNERLFPQREEMRLRVYGFGGEACDLSFLARMPNVRRLHADCLQEATGLEHVAALPKLQDLGIGIYALESFDFLNELATKELTGLSLEATKSKKPTLESLARYPKLRRLYLEGQQKEIDVVAGLAALEDVTLRSITVAGLDFLRPLTKLRSVDIKLGGTTNLAALAGKACIKYLELWQVRGLADISMVSTLAGLQSLFLQSLPQVKKLPDVSSLRKLRRVHLETMKGLTDVRGLAAAPALEELLHLDAKGMKPADYAEVLKSKTLKRLCVGTGSVSKNREIKAMAAATGVATERGEMPEFVFA